MRTQQLILLLVKCCVLLGTCVYYVQCPAPKLCNKAALNAAADLTLYFMKNNYSDYIDIPDVKEDFLKDSMHLHAKGGSFGSVHSVERVGDFELAFTNELSNNYDKPLTRKIYTSVRAKFSKIHIEFNDTIIKFKGCSIKGEVTVDVKNNLFEAVTVSSEKKSCLMEVRLVKYHKFGPIDFQIDPEKGKLCAAWTSSVVNKFNQYFSFFTKKEIRKHMIRHTKKVLKSSNTILCISPTFDVVFV